MHIDISLLIVLFGGHNLLYIVLIPSSGIILEWFKELYLVQE